MSTLFVNAVIVAKHGSTDLVKAELLKLIPPTLNENGCIQYLLHQDQGNPAQFIFYEEWSSKAELDLHLESNHIKAGQAAMDGHLETVDINLLNKIS